MEHGALLTAALPVPVLLVVLSHDPRGDSAAHGILIAIASTQCTLACFTRSRALVFFVYMHSRHNM